ncbi:MAG: cell division protein ZapA [candidate division WOR-3 bacterium]
MKTLTVNILGYDYHVRTSEADEAVLGIAREIVDTRLREVRERYRDQPLAQSAILTCLDLVGEFLAAEAKHDSRICVRLQTLIDKLDRT